ncbi:hypothetical protein, partial [Paenibacillus alba]
MVTKQDQSNKNGIMCSPVSHISIQAAKYDVLGGGHFAAPCLLAALLSSEHGEAKQVGSRSLKACKSANVINL